MSTQLRPLTVHSSYTTSSYNIINTIFITKSFPHTPLSS